MVHAFPLAICLPTLTCAAVIINEHLNEALRRLRRNTSDQNTTVDRRLVTNILLSFLTAPRGDSKRFEMLKVLSDILSWNESEREKAGLQRSPASAGAARSPGRVNAELEKTDETEVRGLPVQYCTTAFADKHVPRPSHSPRCGSSSCSRKPTAQTLLRPRLPAQQCQVPSRPSARSLRRTCPRPMRRRVKDADQAAGSVCLRSAPRRASVRCRRRRSRPYHSQRKRKGNKGWRRNIYTTACVVFSYLSMFSGCAMAMSSFILIFD